jgi:hypothetical protein
MTRKSFFAICLGAPAAVLVWWKLPARKAEKCAACDRPVHDHMRTVASVEGKKNDYCCLACALSVHMQGGKPVEVVSVANFRTSAPLKPAEAFVVRDSDLNPCGRHEHAFSAEKRPLESHYDRCSPSMLAFASLEEARGFMKEHGGRLMRLNG